MYKCTTSRLRYKENCLLIWQWKRPWKWESLTCTNSTMMISIHDHKCAIISCVFLMIPLNKSAHALFIFHVNLFISKDTYTNAKTANVGFYVFDFKKNTTEGKRWPHISSNHHHEHRKQILNIGTYKYQIKSNRIRSCSTVFFPLSQAMKTRRLQWPP